MLTMKNRILFWLCTATLALAAIYSPGEERSTRAASLPSQAAPAGTQIWQVLPSKSLKPGEVFSLYTWPPGQFVKYGRRDYGVNLVWAPRKHQHDNGAPANFTLARESGASDQLIKYGEAVALKEKTGGYLYYKTRKYGINLEFSANPVYEWELRGGPAGTPVGPGKTGDAADSISDVVIGLYNRKTKCYVVYGTREYGINLIWKGGAGC